MILLDLSVKAYFQISEAITIYFLQFDVFLHYYISWTYPGNLSLGSGLVLDIKEIH